MTHLELLQTLPSPYREQAIENCKTQSGETFLKAKLYCTIGDIIDNGFSWEETSEKENFWNEIHERALAGEFDDPSVTLPREDWEELIESAQKGRCANKLIEAIQSQLNPKQ